MKRTLIGSAVWVLANIGLFALYHVSLGLHVSTLTVVFVGAFALSTVCLFLFFRHVVAQGVVAFFYTLFLLYALFQFAYFKVFHTFWWASFSAMRQTNGAMLTLLADYIFLVPWYVYVVTVVLPVGLFFLRRPSRPAAVSQPIPSFIAPPLITQPRRMWGRMGLLLGVVGLQLCAVFGVVHYRRTIDPAHFSREQVFADLSVYGSLVDQFLNITVQAATTDTPLAQEVTITEETSVSDGITAPLPPPTDVSRIRDAFQSLASRQTSSSSTTIEALNPLGATPHIIIYQMESVSRWPLLQNPSPMPFLQQQMDTGIHTGTFFANSCTTVNAEFATLCSFYADANGPIGDLFAYNDYHCLPSILRERYGYATNVYHANSDSFWNRDALMPRWGFENRYFTPRFKVRTYDQELLEDVVTNITKSSKPTFHYVIGFTSHSPHTQAFMNHYQELNKVTVTPYAAPLNQVSQDAEPDEQTTRNYLGFLKLVDDGIRQLFTRLETEGLLDQTIVIVFGDHRFYQFTSGDPVSDYYHYNDIPFFMHVPEGFSSRVQDVASHVDIAPTLLHYLSGDEAASPEGFIGHSLFSSVHPNAAINKCLGMVDYVDREHVVRGDIRWDAFRFIQKSATDLTDIQMYAEALKQIVQSSDALLLKNTLSKYQAGFSANRERPLPTQLDYTQATDTDKDGLSDLREKALGTSRLNPDTDGDGYRDGDEQVAGYSPLAPPPSLDAL